MIKLKNNQVKDLNRMMKESIIRMESLNVTVLLIVGKKRSWTADEDAYLIKLVQKYGAQKWTSIAQHLPGKYPFIQGGLENSADKDGTII